MRADHESSARHASARDDLSLIAAARRQAAALSLRTSSSVALQPLPEGMPSRIGHYRILRELGHGSLGRTFLAVHQDEHVTRRVAIKFICRSPETRELIRRFEFEREAVFAMNHPNIAEIVETGLLDDGRTFVAAEYIEGRPIDQYCDEQHLTIHERLRLFRKVCAIVQIAHQHLLIHRGLKPSNILVCKNNEPKLLDFTTTAIVISLGGTPEVTPDFVSSSFVRDYASPEQVLGRPLSTASDVYSLGVVLYELLTGRRPYRFGSRSDADITRILREIKPAAPSAAIRQVPSGSTVAAGPEQIAGARGMTIVQLVRQLSGDLDSIVLKALDGNPRHRYQTVEQMADDITRVLERKPVSARRAPLPERITRRMQCHPVGTATMAAILLGFVALFAGGVFQWRNTAQIRIAAEFERRRAETEHARLTQQSDAFHAMLSCLTDRLAGIAPRLGDGANTRLALAEAAASAVQATVASRSSDPRVRRRIASLHRLIGDLRTGAPGFPEEPLASYACAQQILTLLTAEDRNDAEAEWDLALLRIRIGDARGHTNDMERAIAEYRLAEVVLRARRARDSTDIAVARALAGLFERLGDFLERSGDSAGGDHYRREAGQIQDGIPGRLLPDAVAP